MATLDFFYDLASTYSYLAAVRIGPARAGCGRDGTLASVPARRDLQDARLQYVAVQPPSAEGAQYGARLRAAMRRTRVPFRLPSPFPAMSLLAGRVAHVGLTEGWGEDFSRAVYRAEFGEGLDIGELAVIAAIVSGLGHDAEAALARAGPPRSRLRCAPRPRRPRRSAFSARQAL